MMHFQNEELCMHIMMDVQNIGVTGRIQGKEWTTGLMIFDMYIFLDILLRKQIIAYPVGDMISAHNGPPAIRYAHNANSICINMAIFFPFLFFPPLSGKPL
jgi:hypothetical protein